jgi:hypothetical protein
MSFSLPGKLARRLTATAELHGVLRSHFTDPVAK